MAGHTKRKRRWTRGDEKSHQSYPYPSQNLRDIHMKFWIAFVVSGLAVVVGSMPGLLLLAAMKAVSVAAFAFLILVLSECWGGGRNRS